MNKKAGNNTEVSSDDVPDNLTQTRSQKRKFANQKKTAAKRQRLLLILIGSSLVFNLILGYSLYDPMVASKSRDRLAQVSQNYANQAGEAMESYIEAKQQEVITWASNPSLSTSLNTNNSLTDNVQSRSALERQLQKARPGILAARIIPKGQGKLEPDHLAPIRYAELDLIRRSARRERTLPEAAPLDEGWQLHVASPIPADGEGDADGTLLITFDHSAAQEALRRFDEGNGKFELLQTFSSTRPLPLVSIGEGKASSPAIRTVANSFWSVAFTPQEKLVDVTAGLPSLWLIVLSLTTTGCFALSLLLSKLLVRDSQTDTEAGLELPKGFIDTHKDAAGSQAAQTFKNRDVLDIAMVGDDADILGLGRQTSNDTFTVEETTAPIHIPTEIFRAYDIRGAVGSALTPELAEHIGRAIGSETIEQGDDTLIVARDGRTHSPELCEKLITGILSTGCNIINIGVTPTPLMHFATHEFPETSSGVMVTASHNPADQNGFKVVINGSTLADDGITNLRSRISQQKYLSGKGREQNREIIPAYIDRIFSDIALAGDITIVVDAANAVAGKVAPALFEELGCNVIPLHCELDGTFPNHEPDPSKVENLQELIAKVKETNADLGVAFDGDGDRLIIVTPKGDIIWPDRLLMLFAKDILSRNPGADVIFDVKCSKQLNQLISSYGGRPIMWKTGHSHMKKKMIETGALIGGEFSGHIFIKERWYGFDDGLYTTARLLEIITLRDQPIDEVFASYPMLPCTPEIRVAIDEDKKFDIVKALIEKGAFQDGKATKIDGLRIDFSSGWGLVRASNTSAELTLRFEADTPELLEKMQQLFKRELLKIDKTLNLDGF